jgi:hypothetical protein
MSLSSAQRTRLQLEAEQALLHLESTMLEVGRRRRRAVHLAHGVAALTLLVASGMLVRFMLRRSQLPSSMQHHPNAPDRAMEAVLVLLAATVLRAWVNRLEMSPSMLTPPLLGPNRPS